MNVDISRYQTSITGHVSVVFFCFVCEVGRFVGLILLAHQKKGKRTSGENQNIEIVTQNWINGHEHDTMSNVRLMSNLLKFDWTFWPFKKRFSLLKSGLLKEGRCWKINFNLRSLHNQNVNRGVGKHKKKANEMNTILLCKT